MKRPAVHGLKIRPASKDDIGNICAILSQYGGKRLLLPRPPHEIEAQLPSFRVAELGRHFAGCVALRDFGNRLYEVRSLAVRDDMHGVGIGSSLVSDILQSTKDKAPCRVFALTYRAEFFVRLGFTIVDKSLFPEKIWSDCYICPKKENCDETAVMLDLA